jgi:cell division protein FtsN
MAAARRKKAGTRRGKQGTPAWMWLLTGVLMGLGLAWYLFAKGYIARPAVDRSAKTETVTPGADQDSEEVAPAEDGQKKSRYDFFTVLPEMEVVVPEQELSTEGEAPVRTAQDDQASYLLQVGSFRNKSDADAIKAELALLGMMARIQTVTVNEVTWHRVRVGPVSGARQADEIRQQLTAKGYDSLVMKNP